MTVETVNPNAFGVTITTKAQQHLLDQLDGTNAVGVSLILKPSGCAGFSYNWGIAKDLSEEDVVLASFNGYSLITNGASGSYLNGSTIELKQEGIQGSHLEVVSPKVVDACGCGESVRFS